MDSKNYLQTYLIKTLPRLIFLQNQQNNNKQQHIYNLIRIRRYLLHTIMIFSFQYLTTFNLSFSYLPLPFYPPIGIVFISFYLLGSNATLGLLLGSFLAYLLKGLPVISIFFYLIADVGCGCLGAVICQNIFSSDIRPFSNRQETYKFIKMNALITCTLSSLARMVALIPTLLENKVKFNFIFFTYVDLWLGDLNSILILSSFLLSWVYVPFSREKILTTHLRKSVKILFIITLVALIGFSLALIKKYQLIYFYIIAMLLSLYISYFYGYLIATGLLFIIASLYLAYFIVHQYQFLIYLGIVLYTLVPAFLLLFTLCALYAGHFKLRNKSNKKNT
jgi:hypothetical protein